VGLFRRIEHEPPDDLPDRARTGLGQETATAKTRRAKPNGPQLSPLISQRFSSWVRFAVL
jgi:hypothetical protein